MKFLGQACGDPVDLCLEKLIANGEDILEKFIQENGELAIDISSEIRVPPAYLQKLINKGTN